MGAAAGSAPDHPPSRRDPWPRAAAVAAAAWRARPGRPPGAPLRLPGTGEAAAVAETASDAPRGGHPRGPWSHCGPRTGSCARRGRPGAASRRMCDRAIEGTDAAAAEARAAVGGGGGRAGATATEADPSDPARESTGNEAARVRTKPRHRPWVSPRRTKSPVGPRRLRTAAVPEPEASPLLFSLGARQARAWRACADGRGLRSFSLPRDSALAGHVSPPPSGRVRGGGGGCGMSLSERGRRRACGGGGGETGCSWATPPPTAERRSRAGVWAGRRRGDTKGWLRGARGEADAGLRGGAGEAGGLELRGRRPEA